LIQVKARADLDFLIQVKARAEARNLIDVLRIIVGILLIAFNFPMGFPGTRRRAILLDET
jgi:hypothetical protein